MGKAQGKSSRVWKEWPHFKMKMFSTSHFNPERNERIYLLLAPCGILDLRASEKTQVNEQEMYQEHLSPLGSFFSSSLLHISVLRTPCEICFMDSFYH